MSNSKIGSTTDHIVDSVAELTALDIGPNNYVRTRSYSADYLTTGAKASGGALYHITTITAQRAKLGDPVWVPDGTVDFTLNNSNVAVDILSKDLSVSGVLGITGLATLTGGAAIATALSVSGPATLTSTLGITGASTLSTLSATTGTFSGDTIVGKASPDSIGSIGHQFSATGFTAHARSGGTVMQIDRKSSDGNIIEFYKDVSLLGSIGSSGGNLVIDSTAGLNIVGDTSVTGDLALASGQLRVSTQKTPASASATGVKGEIAHDTNYIYVCTATDTWKRVAIATW